MSASSRYRCSFCGKAQHEVRRLIAGPGSVYICDECVELCREIIEEDEPTRPGQPRARRLSEGATFIQREEGWYQLLKDGVLVRVTREETPELYQLIEEAMHTPIPPEAR